MSRHSEHSALAGVPFDDLLAEEHLELSAPAVAHGRGLTLRSAMTALLAAGGPSTAPLELPSTLLAGVGIRASVYPAHNGLLSFVDEEGAPISIRIGGAGVSAVDSSRYDLAYAWMFPGDSLQLTTGRGASVVGEQDGTGLGLGLVMADREARQPAGTSIVDRAEVLDMAAQCRTQDLRDRLEQAANGDDSWQLLSALADALLAPDAGIAPAAERILSQLSGDARDTARHAAIRHEAVLSVRESDEKRVRDDDGIPRRALTAQTRKERARLQQLRRFLKPF